MTVDPETSDIENLPMAAASLDAHGCVRAFNLPFEERFGSPAPGVPFLKAVGASTADPDAWATLRASRSSDGVVVSTTSGSTVTVWLGPGGQTPWIAMVGRGGAPGELERAAKRLETVVNDLTDAIMVEDEHRRIVISNVSFSAMFGLPPPEAIVGWDCSGAAEQSKGAFVDPEGFVERIEAILAARVPVEGDELRLVDGRILLRDYVPTLVDGTYAGHLWRYVDVTGPRKMLQELHFERRRADAVINASLDAVVTVDEHGRVLYWNAAAERIFGHTEAEVLGRDMGDIIVPATHREAHAAGMARVRSTGQERITNQRLELLAVRRDGSVFPCEVTVTRQLYTDRVLFTGFLRDITEFVAAREAVKSVSEAKSRLMAAVSHDMRSPLVNILHRSEVLGAQPTEQELSAHVKSVERSVWRIVAMLDELVSAGASPSGQAPLTVEQVDLVGAIQDVISQRATIVRRKGLELRLETVGDGPFTLETDLNRVIQVLSNLVDNAVKYTHAGEVVVLLGPAEGGCRIAVRDTGIGFGPETAARIFDLGFQADVSVSGLGLGLSIVREVVDRLGGRIEVRSAPGEGSEFEVWLPAHTRA